MIRKIYILTLLGIFFISTTGLPLSLHICSMNGLSSAETCKMHKIAEEDHSCCNKEDESPLKITLNEYDGCCQLKMIERNLTDQLLTAANDIISKTSIKIILTGITASYQSPVLSAHLYYNSNSSPPLSDNLIYLDNSVLLI
jgi:hypothetical protein